MAEINVQTKKHSSLWLWILVVLIAAAIIYFLTRNNNRNTNAAVDQNTTSFIQAAPYTAETAV